MDWISSMIPLPIRRGLAHTLGFFDDSSPTLVDRPLQFQDIIAARDILVQFFPPELVYIILHFAAYCAPLSSSVHAQQVQLQASHWPGDNASLNYLVTSPTLDQYRHEDKTFRVKVMRVEFSILSRDQGWCTDPDIRGTYRGSSWFEAAILRPSQAGDAAAALRLTYNFDEYAPVDLDVYDPDAYDLRINIPTVYHPAFEVRADADADAGTRWALQWNFCGSPEDREHVVSWVAVADDTANTEIDGSVNVKAETGAGDGEGFVASLRPGDSIAVIARARYPGWANFIKRVEVSVYYGLA
ncbi:hypothetical protein B0H19DRAFT_1383539 [Mycena capillaripes]|nr:hypothetical protein B0H19DRAFT_1383539 [Mycena capillaripes]